MSRAYVLTVADERPTFVPPILCTSSLCLDAGKFICALWRRGTSLIPRVFLPSQYPAYPDFIDSVRKEAEQNVTRIRHHASLVSDFFYRRTVATL